MNSEELLRRKEVTMKPTEEQQGKKDKTESELTEKELDGVAGGAVDAFRPNPGTVAGAVDAFQPKPGEDAGLIGLFKPGAKLPK